MAELKHKQAVYAETKKKQTETSIVLPADFSQTIPARGLAWLGSAGITLHNINSYSIGYSESLHRVCIPVYYNGKATDELKEYKGYVARALETWQKPKYLEKLQDKHPFCILHSDNTLCIVEDILSCIRVGKYCSCLSLNGTSLTDQAIKIIQLYKNIIVWLDPDTAGKKGTAKIKSRLFKPIKIIQSDKDPKRHTDDYIKDSL